jgi:hypothetical protein
MLPFGIAMCHLETAGRISESVCAKMALRELYTTYGLLISA